MELEGGGAVAPLEVEEEGLFFPLVVGFVFLFEYAEKNLIYVEHLKLKVLKFPRRGKMRKRKSKT